MIVLIGLVTLVASFALTAFCFYKIAGLTLLGQPRSSSEERANWEKQDVPRSMDGIMVLMALLCLLLGLLPGLIIPLFAPVVEAIGLPALPAVPDPFGFSLSRLSRQALLPALTTYP